MPTINITPAEYEAIDFFTDMASTSMESCDNDDLQTEFNKHAAAHRRLVEKYRKARYKSETRAMVKRALKRAEEFKGGKQ